ncbi:MAG: RluA family pseudouridine synthase [Saccharofermentans sp.]|nr:RluA family pseudouridine synthase [Saccharofermentans sp.]
MRQFTVSDALNGEHVVKACTSNYPSLKKADLYKALKHKDIRIDGKRVSSDIKVSSGQVVQVWLPDGLFEQDQDELKRRRKDAFSIVAQTDGLLIVNKRQGLAVHSGKTTEDNLIDIVREETHNRNAELVHRIDMNTGGILMIAKDKDYLEDAVKLFKGDLVTKRYRALVVGRIPGDLGEPVVCTDDALMNEVSAYLEKTKSGEVYIHDVKKEGDLPITTRYRVLAYSNGLSDIECELVTGRTHQIRAQFAHMGYPVLGDGNYGRNQVNLGFESKDGGKIRFQQLWSTTLLFGKIPSDNKHRELSGRKFSIEPRYEVSI